MSHDKLKRYTMDTLPWSGILWIVIPIIAAIYLWKTYGLGGGL